MLFPFAAAKVLLGIPLSEADTFLSRHPGITTLALLAFPPAYLFWVLVLCALPTQPGPNRFGPEPFGRPAAADEPAPAQ